MRISKNSYYRDREREAEGRREEGKDGGRERGLANSLQRGVHSRRRHCFLGDRECCGR